MKLTRKRHPKSIGLHFFGPAEKREEAVKALRKLGFVEESASIPWREVLGRSLPGSLLAGARYKEDITQVELSKLTGIPQRHISEMENGKRGIGKERAKIFGKALNIDYRIFL